MKIKVNDTVIVTKGKDAQKKGKVEKVFPGTQRVQVAGINLVKKHQKKKSEKVPGGIIDITMPMAISKVSLICPKCSQKTRVGFSIESDGKKYRVCKKCKQVI